MRPMRSLLVVVLCACGPAANQRPGEARISSGVVDPVQHIAYLAINQDTQILQSQGIQTLSVPGPAWVFIVKDGAMVCGTEQTASGTSFPRTISIAKLDYGTSTSIHAVAVPLSAGASQRLDGGCYSLAKNVAAPDTCALCIACQSNSIGCCVGPGALPTLPQPCSF